MDILFQIIIVACVIGLALLVMHFVDINKFNRQQFENFKLLSEVGFNVAKATGIFKNQESQKILKVVETTIEYCSYLINDTKDEKEIKRLVELYSIRFSNEFGLSTTDENKKLISDLINLSFPILLEKAKLTSTSTLVVNAL